MSHGYTLRLVELNAQADPKTSLGVKLGRVCIKKRVPVQEIASALSVSRQTIYNWFVGGTSPHPDYEIRIANFIDKLSND